MFKSLIAVVFVLSSIPVFAKPSDVYPASCNDLWAAVRETLQDPRNYGILSIDDTEQTVMFNVTGATRVRIDSVALTPKDNGCEMKLTFKESGYGNEDEAAFRKRVSRSLAKLVAAKPGAHGTQ
jgi:hypothetical protein